MAVDDLTFARLRELLHYDSSTGALTWAIRSRPGCRYGDTAGTPHSGGYVTIRLDGRRYLAHRLAWFWVTGCLPAHDIDHRNGRRSDNRLANLRPSTRSANLQNQRVAKSHNKQRLLGVVVDKRRPHLFMARIVVRGKQLTIGTFGSAEEAHAAYIATKRQLHPACTL